MKDGHGEKGAILLGPNCLLQSIQECWLKAPQKHWGNWIWPHGEFNIFATEREEKRDAMLKTKPGRAGLQLHPSHSGTDGGGGTEIPVSPCWGSGGPGQQLCVHQGQPCWSAAGFTPSILKEEKKLIAYVPQLVLRNIWIILPKISPLSSEKWKQPSYKEKKKTTNQHDRNTAAKPYMQQKTGTFSGSLSTMQHCQPCLRKAPNSHSFQYSATGTNCFPAMLGCGARALPRHLLLHWCQPRLLLLPAPPLSEPWTTDSASLQHFMHQQSFVFRVLGFKPHCYTGNGWGFCPQAHWTWGGLYCPWGRSVVEQERHGGGWDHRKVQVWWSSEGWGQEGRGGEAGRAAEGGVHFLKERGETGQGWWKLGIQVHAAQQMRSRAKSPKPRFIWIQDPLHANSS